MLNVYDFARVDGDGSAVWFVVLDGGLKVVRFDVKVK